MSRYRLAAAALFVALLVLVSGCGGGVSQREVLADLTDHVITPRFEAAAAWAVALDATVSTLTTQPSSDALGDAREAWRSARGAWSRTAAMWFGPVMERRSGPLMNWWPIDPKLIEKTIAERDSISPEDVRERFASTQRGLSALEYLLFQDDDRLLRELGEPSSRFGEYLRALTAVIVEETAGVRDAWSGADGDQFAGRGDRVIAESLAIADLVRVTIFLTETVGDMQLGGALGALNGEPEIEAIPGGAAEYALDDLREAVLGIQELYLGSGETLGLGDLIAELSDDTDQRVHDAFSRAVNAIDAVSGPLKRAVLATPDDVAAAREAIKHLQRVLNTEVVSLLGVSVGFSDNDGDS